jgi:ribosomal protein S18 acetylase RimI-like enzyme
MATVYERTIFTEQFWDELHPLVSAEFAEVMPAGGSLNFDVNKFINHEKLGYLRVFTARRDGLLIGYFAAIVVLGSITCADAKTSGSVGWYVKPQYRGVVGIRLLDYAEKYLEAEGVERCGVCVMSTSNAAIRLLEHKGYSEAERTYHKRLGA